MVKNVSATVSGCKTTVTHLGQCCDEISAPLLQTQLLSALEGKQDLVNSCNLSDWATTPLWLFINYRHSWAGHPVISCSRGMTPAGCRWNKAYMQSRRPVYILGMAAVRLSHSSSTATVWQKGSAASAETSSSLQKETDSPLAFCTGHF